MRDKKSTMWKLNHEWRRPYLNQNHNFRTQMWDLYIKMKLLQQHHFRSIHNLNRQSLRKIQQEKENNSSDLENLYPQTCSKKGGRCDGFKEISKDLEVFFIKVSENERRSYLTNFVAVLIINGHKTKLDSNFVLALSLFYWPINWMSGLNSPTHRNLVLTSNDLQLMHSIVSRPYMILMKCWWK